MSSPLGRQTLLMSSPLEGGMGWHINIQPHLTVDKLVQESPVIWYPIGLHGLIGGGGADQRADSPALINCYITSSKRSNSISSFRSSNRNSKNNTSSSRAPPPPLASAAAAAAAATAAVTTEAAAAAAAAAAATAAAAAALSQSR